LNNTSDIIRNSDDCFKKRLYEVADDIAAREGIRIIGLSGPTCSGKTTAAIMLAERLESKHKRVHTVSIDDFYYDRDYLHRMSLEKGNGEIDYDSVDTIDLDALSLFIQEAFSHKTVHSPIFDFKMGKRVGYKSFEPSEDHMFIFEGIQAIYPELVELFKPHGYVSVYICPLTALTEQGRYFEPNELRLMRRLVRDSNFRGATAEFTFKVWKSVRNNEDKHIFPYADSANYKIDSTLVYEIGVLKPYLEKILREIDNNSESYSKSRDILEKIANISGISSSLIEEGSLYKEFV